MRKKPTHRLVRLLLVAVYAAQISIVQASELSVWNDRRSGLELARIAVPPPLVLHLAPAVASHGTVPGRALSLLSPSMGTVRGGALSPEANVPLVIHILDVHQNRDAQMRISEAIRALTNSGGASLLALEGAFGAVDFSAARAYDDPASLNAAADHLLSSLRISGPAHAALRGANSHLVTVGIDDPTAYRENVAAYLSATRAKADTEKILGERRRAAQVLVQNALGDKAKAFDTLLQERHEGREAFGPFVRALAAQSESAGMSLGDEVSRFLEALSIEQSLDFSRAEAERTRVLSDLARTLSPPALADLSHMAEEYRDGRITHGAFYAALARIAGPAIERFPALAAYLRYVSLYDRIDGAKLLEETEALEKNLARKLARTSAESEALEARAACRLTERLSRFELSPAEWKRAEAMGLAAGVAPGFGAFYSTAERRNGLMASRFLAAMSEGHHRCAILVTGGFHAENVDAALRQAGLSVVTFIPRVSEVDRNGSAYLTVFSQEKSPLERLGEGEKLFLAPEVWTPGKALLVRATATLRTLFLAAGSMPRRQLVERAQALLGRNIESVTISGGRARLRFSEGAEIQANFDEAGRFAGVDESIRLGRLRALARALIELPQTLRLLLPRSEQALREFVARHGVSDAVAVVQRLAGAQALRVLTWTGTFSGLLIFGGTAALIGASGPATFTAAAAGMLVGFFSSHLGAHAAFIRLFPESPLSLTSAAGGWMPLEVVAYKSSQIRELPTRAEATTGGPVRDDFAPHYSQFLDDSRTFLSATRLWNSSLRVDTSILNQGGSEYQGAIESLANGIDAVLQARGADAIGRFGNGFRTVLAVLKLFPGPNSRVNVTTRVTGGPARRISFHDRIDGGNASDHFEVSWERLSQSTSVSGGTRVDVVLDGNTAERQRYLDGLEGALARAFAGTRNLPIVLRRGGEERVINPVSGLRRATDGRLVPGYAYPSARVEIEIREDGFSIIDHGTGISDEILLERFFVPRSPTKPTQQPGDFAILFEPRTASPEDVRASTVRVTKGGRTIFSVEGARGRNLPEVFEIELPPSAWVTESWDRFELGTNGHSDVGAKSIVRAIVRGRASVEKKIQMLNAFALVLLQMREVSSANVVEAAASELAPWLAELRAKGAVIVPNNKPGFFELARHGRQWHFLHPALIPDFTPEALPGVMPFDTFGPERAKFEVVRGRDRFFLSDFTDPQTVSFDYNGMVFLSRRHFQPHNENPAPPELWERRGETTYEYRGSSRRRSFRPADDRVVVPSGAGRSALPETPQLGLLTAGQRAVIGSLVGRAHLAVAEAFVRRLSEFVTLLTDHAQTSDWLRVLVSAVVRRPRLRGNAAAQPVARWNGISATVTTAHGKDLYFLSDIGSQAIYVSSIDGQPRKLVDIPARWSVRDLAFEDGHIFFVADTGGGSTDRIQFFSVDARSGQLTSFPRDGWMTPQRIISVDGKILLFNRESGVVHMFDEGQWKPLMVVADGVGANVSGPGFWSMRRVSPGKFTARRFSGLTARPTDWELDIPELDAPGLTLTSEIEMTERRGVLFAVASYGSVKKFGMMTTAGDAVIELPESAAGLSVDDQYAYFRDMDEEDRAILYRVPINVGEMTMGEVETIELPDARRISSLTTIDGRVYAALVTASGDTELFAADELRAPAEGGPVRRALNLTGIKQMSPTFDFQGQRMFVGFNEQSPRELQLYTMGRNRIDGTRVPRTSPEDRVDVAIQGGRLYVAVTIELSDEVRLYQLADNSELEEIDVVDSAGNMGHLVSTPTDLMLIAGSQAQRYRAGHVAGSPQNLLPSGAEVLEIVKSGSRTFAQFRHSAGSSIHFVEMRDGRMNFSDTVDLRPMPLRQVAIAGRETFGVNLSGNSLFHRVAREFQILQMPGDFDNILEVASVGEDLFLIATLGSGPRRLYRTWVLADGVTLHTEMVDTGDVSQLSNLESLNGEIYFNGDSEGTRWRMSYRPGLRETSANGGSGVDRLILMGSYGHTEPQAHSVELDGVRYSLVFEAPGRWSLAAITDAGIQTLPLPLARDHDYFDLAVWNGRLVISSAAEGGSRVVYEYHGGRLEKLMERPFPPGDPYLVPGNTGLMVVGPGGAAVMDGSGARDLDLQLGTGQIVSVHRTPNESYAAIEEENGDLMMARLVDGRISLGSAYLVGRLPSPKVVSFSVDDIAYVIADSQTDSDAPRGLFRLGDDAGVEVQVPQGRAMEVAAFHGRLYLVVRSSGGEDLLYSGRVIGADTNLRFEGEIVATPEPLGNFEFDATPDELYVVATTAAGEHQRFRVERSSKPGVRADALATINGTFPNQPPIALGDAYYSVLPSDRNEELIHIQDGEVLARAVSERFNSIVEMGGVMYWVQRDSVGWILRKGDPAQGNRETISRFEANANPRLIATGGQLFVVLERDHDQAYVLDSNVLVPFSMDVGNKIMDIVWWDGRFVIATSWYGTAWVQSFNRDLTPISEGRDMGPVTLRAFTPMENQLLISDVHGNEEWGLRASGRDGRPHAVRVPVDTDMSEMVSFGERLVLVVDRELNVGTLEGAPEDQTLVLRRVPLDGHLTPQHVVASAEGVRFFARSASTGKVELVFLSWEKIDHISTERGPPPLGTVPTESLIDRLPAFLASRASFFSEYPALREQLINRLYYERDPGWPLDDGPLLVLAMIPSEFLDQLEPETLDTLGRFAATRDIQSLRRFFNVAELAAPGIPEGQATAFFQRWIELFDTMAARRGGLNSLFESLETREAEGLLAQQAPVQDSQSADTRLLLYVRFLRGEVAELLHEVADVSVGYDENLVIDRLTSPVSLARVNLSHQALRNTDADIARGLPRSGLETAPNIRSFEAMVRGHAQRKADSQEAAIQSAIKGQDKSENVAARELVQNARDASPGAPIRVESFLRPEAHEWVRRVSDDAGMSLATILGPLLVLEVSDKGGTAAAGLFGQGFYTMFADYDRVRIKTGRDGRTFHLTIEKDEKGLPQIVDFVETTEAFKGTVIDWVRDYDERAPPYLEGLLFAQDLIRYVGAVSGTDITYNGRAINELMDAEESVDAEFVEADGTRRIGEVKVRLSPSTTQKRVTQKDLFVMPVQEWMFDLVPPKLQQFLLGRGFNIDIPDFLPITRTRTGIVYEARHRAAIQQAVFAASLRLAVRIYFVRNRLPPGLAEDFLWSPAVQTDDAPDQHLMREAITDALLIDDGSPAAVGSIDFEAYRVRSGEPESVSARKVDRLAGILSVIHVVAGGERHNLWTARQELKRAAEARNAANQRTVLERLSGLAGAGFVDRARQNMEDAGVRLSSEDTPTLELTPEEARTSPSLARLLDFYERMLSVLGPARGRTRVSIAYHPTDGSSYYRASKDTIFIKLSGNLHVLEELDRVLASGSYREAFEFFLEHLDTALHELTHESDRGSATHQAYDIEHDDGAELPYFAGEEHDLPNIGGFGWRLKKLVGRYLQALNRGAWESVRADVMAAHPSRPNDLDALRVDLHERHQRLIPPDINELYPGAWAAAWLGVENVLRWMAGRPPLSSITVAQARWRFPLYGALEGGMALGLGLALDPMSAALVWAAASVVLHLWMGVFSVDVAGRLAPASAFNARGREAIAMAVVTGAVGIALLAVAPALAAFASVGVHAAYNFYSARRFSLAADANAAIRERVVARAKNAGLVVAAPRFEDAEIWPVTEEGAIDRELATWLSRASETDVPGAYLRTKKVSLAQLRARFEADPQAATLNFIFVPELQALVEDVPFEPPNPTISENWTADWFRGRRPIENAEWVADPLGGDPRFDETIYQVGFSRLVRNGQTGMVRQNPRMIAAVVPGQFNLASPVLTQRARERGALYARRIVDWLEGMGRSDLVGQPLLEVGAGAGFLVDQLRESGWPVKNLSGVDTDPHQVQVGKDQLHLGDILQQADIHSINRPAGSVKVIVMVATLEHLADPRGAVLAAQRLLAPDGVLLIVDLPNSGGVLGEGGGANFTHYAWDEHWHHFRYETISRLLGLTGFEIVADMGLGRAPFGRPGEAWWHPMDYVARRLHVAERRTPAATLAALKRRLVEIERSLVIKHGESYRFPPGLDRVKTVAEFETWWNLRLSDTARLSHDMTVMAVKRERKLSPVVEEALRRGREFLSGRTNENGDRREPALVDDGGSAMAIAQARAAQVLAFTSREPFPLPPVINFGLALAERPIDLSAISLVDARMLESAIRSSVGTTTPAMNEAEAQQRLTPLFIDGDVRSALDHLGNRDLVLPVASADRALAGHLLDGMIQRGGKNRLVLVGAAAAAWKDELARVYGDRVEIIATDVVREDGERATLHLDRLDAALETLPVERRANLLVALRAGMIMDEGTLAGSRARVLEDLKFILVDELMRAVPIRFTSLEAIARIARIIGRQA